MVPRRGARSPLTRPSWRPLRLKIRAWQRLPAAGLLGRQAAAGRAKRGGAQGRAGLSASASLGVLDLRPRGARVGHLDDLVVDDVSVAPMSGATVFRKVSCSRTRGIFS
jgi:hypothetical protein